MKHEEQPPCYPRRILALGNHGQGCPCLKVLLLFLMVQFQAQREASNNTKVGGWVGVAVAVKEVEALQRVCGRSRELTWISSGAYSRHPPRETA